MWSGTTRQGGRIEREERSDRFTEVEGRFVGYEDYGQSGEKIGTVDDLFVDDVDENENYEYVGVKMGLLGTKSTLIPWQMIGLDDTQRRMVVSTDKDRVKDAPAFDDGEEITPELEEQVYRHFGVERPTTTEECGLYAAYYPDTAETGPTTGQVPTEDTPSTGRVGVTNEDELRVQRTGEELRAGTREREAGAVRVRKRVRTDREQVEVPKGREEVHVDHVPIESEATEAEIGEEEIRVPVTEEEVVTEKRPVAKEELRIRKDAVEDTETVEEDVRREEVEVDDETEPRNNRW